MNKRKLFILVTVILIIIFVFLIFFLSSRNLLNKKTPGKVPLFTPTPTEKSSYSNNDLVIVNADPIEDAEGKNKYSPIKKIVLTFNKTFNFNTLNIQVSPKIELKTSISSSQLTIEPKPPLFWTPDTVYIITIKGGLVAEDGSVMKDDFVYHIQAKLQGGE